MLFSFGFESTASAFFFGDCAVARVRAELLVDADSFEGRACLDLEGLGGFGGLESRESSGRAGGDLGDPFDLVRRVSLAGGGASSSEDRTTARFLVARGFPMPLCEGVMEVVLDHSWSPGEGRE
jgi:hypothetical protein